MFENEELAVASISIYYSWPNITSTYNNQSFSYTWIDGTVVSVTIPEGFYTVPDINSYLQSVMVTNKHYLTTSTGSYVYYLELLENATYYAVQLNAYAVPTAAQAAALGYSLPAGATWVLPVAATTPQLTISSTNNFKTIIGFSAGTYPSVAQSTTYSLTSNSGTAPQVTPVSSVIVCCDKLDNPYAIPDSVMFSLSPDTSYGSLISSRPSEFAWIDLKDGYHNELTISIVDQNFSPLPIKDTNIVVQLMVRKQ